MRVIVKKILCFTAFLFCWNISSAFAMDPSDTREELINNFCAVIVQNFNQGMKIAEEILVSSNIPELSGCFGSISTEIYIEPIKCLLQQIPQDKLLELYKIYSNPRLQEFTNEVSRVYFSIEKYGKEAEKKPITVIYSPTGFMGEIWNIYLSYFSKRMGELRLNTALAKCAAYYFFEDLNNRYPEEIALLNEVNHKYKDFEEQLKALFKQQEIIALTNLKKTQAALKLCASNK